MQKNLNFENTGVKFRIVNNEVYYAVGDVIKLRKPDIELLKERAMRNEPKKIRLCAHKDINDKLHEMFIIFGSGTYVRPHQHPGKSISYHIIEGFADLVLFNETGKMVEIIQMGGYLSNRAFYYRIHKPYYYMPVPRSRFLAFHEITSGPFKNDTVFAHWAPAESSKAAVKKFMGNLEQCIKEFLARKVVGNP